MSLATAFGLRGRPDAREDARTRILLQAAILSGGRTRPAHLLDLSRKGALGHATEPPSSGEIIWLVCQGNEILARTVWVRGSRFGLAFNSGLPSDKLKPLVAEGRRMLRSEPELSD